MDIIGTISNALESQVNLVIIVLIVILALIDLIFKKDLKSQIVSLGVLGTFIGIFMGLQGFNPKDMTNSINGILEGLKTAFFTSIAGMGTALLLSIFQKIFYRNMDDSQSQEKILLDISDKVDGIKHINKLTNEVTKLVKTQSETKNATDSVAHIVQNLFNLQSTSKEDMKEALLKLAKDVNHIEVSTKSLTTAQLRVKDETIKIADSIYELKENSTQENQKMNESLKIAIDKLSKGATEEIIKALEQVIRDFNNELQSQFGENFIELNKAVINLVEWQNNYKSHIEHLDSHLKLSTSSIEKSKDSLEVISSRNEEVVGIYSKLKDTIEIYDQQIKDLTMHLKTYSQLSSNAKSMFSSIEENISATKDEFTNLTKHIKEKNHQQIEYSKETTEQIKVHFNKIQKELDTTSIHFKDINKEIPEALKVSLEALNQGLTSLTVKFKKDYDETLQNYRRGNS